MDRNTVNERLWIALEALLQNDRLLLEYDVSERAIAAKLAHYLVGVFPNHHVDIEYNRHGVDPKRISAPPECTAPTSDRVVPDVVVHRRGDDAHNTLVIEVKKTSSAEPPDCDRARLPVFRAVMGYEHAALVIFPTRDAAVSELPTVEWH